METADKSITFHYNYQGAKVFTLLPCKNYYNSMATTHHTNTIHFYVGFFQPCTSDRSVTNCIKKGSQWLLSLRVYMGAYHFSKECMPHLNSQIDNHL